VHPPNLETEGTSIGWSTFQIEVGVCGTLVAVQYKATFTLGRRAQKGPIMGPLYYEMR